MSSLTVGQIMTRDPFVVAPDTTLGGAMRIMKEKGCRQLPVVKEDALVGIITDRDIRLAMNSPLVLHERADDLALLAHVPVEACMTANPMTVEVSLPAVEVAKLLLKYKFGGLPVLHENKLVGIVSVSNILTSYIQLLQDQ